MILINVRFPIREDRMPQWRELAASYSAAVNAEPGCLFFEFAQSLDEPGTYLTIEGFRDAAAGAAHMQQPHVDHFMSAMPDIVAAQPQIIYVDAEEASGFGPMGEIQPRSS